MLYLLPLGLGLPGFVEPCAISGHLVFLNLLRNPLAGVAMDFLAVVHLYSTRGDGRHRCISRGRRGSVRCGAESLLVALRRGLHLFVIMVYQWPTSAVEPSKSAFSSGPCDLEK